MFTSRAEYRILLRQDNADIRLTEKSHKIGLASDERLQKVQKKMLHTDSVVEFLRNVSVSPEEINGFLAAKESALLTQKVKADKVLSRPHINIQDLILHVPSVQSALNHYDADALEQAEITIKYDGYIQREQEMAGKMLRLEDIRLLPDTNYRGMQSLSIEAREKLTKLKPRTLGQASRISGVSPSDISVLMVYLGR